MKKLLCIAIALPIAASCGKDASDEAREPATPAAKAAQELPSPVPTTEAGTTLVAADRVFEEIAPFVKMASSHGDRASGEHGTFGIFAAGASSPPHTHSGAYHAVVISGEMSNPFGGEADPQKLAPGSYWFVPAGVEHVTSCLSKEPCEFYFHAADKFDFSPLKKLKQARPAAAVTTPNAVLSWDQVAPFVKMAGAHGDRASGAHGTFGMMPGGQGSPKHTHSGAYRGVVISGTATNPFGDEANPPKMGAGSSWHVPAGAPHITACVSEQPCVFYFFADTKFDFAPSK